jgi:hypothetical protein
MQAALPPKALAAANFPIGQNAHALALGSGIRLRFGACFAGKSLLRVPILGL